MLSSTKKRVFTIMVPFLAMVFVACDKVPDDTTNETPPVYTSSVTYTPSGIIINPGKDRPSYTSNVRGVVVDDESLEPLITQILVYDKMDNMVYCTYTDYLGRYELILPEGSYDLTFKRGSEYQAMTLKDHTVYTNATTRLTDMKIKRLYDVGSMGWYAGDLHMHSNYSDGRDLPSEVLKSTIATGQSYAALTDHNTIHGVKEFSMGNYLPVSPERSFIAIPGWEVTTNNGHYHSINNLDITAAVVQTASDVARIASTIKNKEGTIAQINHPGRSDDLGFKFWNMASRFDTLEVWNGTYAPPHLSGDNRSSYNEWLKLMKAGTYLALTGGTDIHDIYGSAYDPDSNQLEWIKRNSYAGSPRNFVKTDDYSLAGILEATKKGNSFISNGPMMFAELNGAMYGESVALSETMTLDYSLKSVEKIDQLKISVNGNLVKTIDIGGVLSFDGNEVLEDLEVGDFVMLEVLGEFASYAISNPIFITA